MEDNKEHLSSYSNISLKEAKALIGDDTISDDDVIKIIDDLKTLCEIASHVYRKANNNDNNEREAA